MANAATTPRDICDMLARPSPHDPFRKHGDQRYNAMEPARFREAGHHLTVCKKFWRAREPLRGPRVIPAAGYPPAPLTGDVGRGCGDASRALLLSKNVRCFRQMPA